MLIFTVQGKGVLQLTSYCLCSKHLTVGWAGFKLCPWHLFNSVLHCTTDRARQSPGYHHHFFFQGVLIYTVCGDVGNRP
jgi:hypothetical protein